MSEESLHKAHAAWAFLRSYRLGNLPSRCVRISDADFSKLAVPLEVMRLEDNGTGHNDAGYTGVCLGHAVYGALFWPVEEEFDLEGNTYYVLDPTGEVKWHHLVQPWYWWVVRTKAAVHCGKVVLQHMTSEPLQGFVIFCVILLFNENHCLDY